LSSPPMVRTAAAPGNLLVAGLLIRRTNLDPSGLLACPLRRLLWHLGYLLDLLGDRQHHAKSQPARRKQCRPSRAAERAPSIDLLISTFPRFNGPVRCTRSIPEMRRGRDRRSESELASRVIAAVEEGVVELAPLPVRALPGSSARSGTPRFFQPPI
jgi:hypothetical protein